MSITCDAAGPHTCLIQLATSNKQSGLCNRERGHDGPHATTLVLIATNTNPQDDKKEK